MKPLALLLLGACLSTGAPAQTLDIERIDRARVTHAAQADLAQAP